MEGMGHLGSDPIVEGARAAKKIADEIERISRGYNKLAVNTFNSADRAEEDRRLEELYDRQRVPSGPTVPLPEEPPLEGEG
jgi:hypothetical protein